MYIVLGNSKRKSRRRRLSVKHMRERRSHRPEAQAHRARPRRSKLRDEILRNEDVMMMKLPPLVQRSGASEACRGSVPSFEEAEQLNASRCSGTNTSRICSAASKICGQWLEQPGQNMTLWLECPPRFITNASISWHLQSIRMSFSLLDPSFNHTSTTRRSGVVLGERVDGKLSGSTGRFESHEESCKVNLMELDYG